MCRHSCHRGFRECFSGSGRLSLCGYQQCLCTSPPLDYRYGWDLGSAHHQAMVDGSFLDLAIASWYSPKCTPWSNAACTSSQASIETRRKDEAPTLQWIAGKLDAADAAEAHTLEQPRGSQMFTQSCLASSLVSSKVSTVILDQCQYGAVLHEKGKGKIPIRKSTELRSVGIQFSDAMKKRCMGKQACPNHQIL